MKTKWRVNWVATPAVGLWFQPTKPSGQYHASQAAGCRLKTGSAGWGMHIPLLASKGYGKLHFGLLGVDL